MCIIPIWLWTKDKLAIINDINFPLIGKLDGKYKYIETKWSKQKDIKYIIMIEEKY